MKKVLLVVVLIFMAFAAGNAVQKYIINAWPSHEEDHPVDPARTSLRTAWAGTEENNGLGDLVLEQDGQPVGRWSLDGIWMEDWLDVPIHYTAVRTSRFWHLAWRVKGSDTVIQHKGAVVWFPDGQAPAFWSGLWERTESHDGDDPCTYHYQTTVVPTPGRGSGLGLQLRLVGKGLGMEHDHATVFCAAKQQADGSWRFVVDDMNRLHIERMLACEALSGLHEQLRAFLPAE